MLPGTRRVSVAALLDGVRDALPEIEAEARLCDRDGRFPSHGIALLHEHGALAAPVPTASGGLGLGTEPAGALDLLRLLRLVGAGNLSLGRLFEGHVNALKLIACYGDASQIGTAAADARDGALFGIWVTEGPDPLRMRHDGDAILLAGEKLFASGAMQVTRPLVTALSPEGDARMLVVPLDAGRNAAPMTGGLGGMRGACTGRCDFTGLRLDRSALIGAAGDYLRQPEFSAGAWRGIAVALGGIDRLLDLLRRQLASRGRDENPHQRVRIGEALIARETASMWARKAALMAEGGRFEPQDVSATVNLARIAAEQAGLDVIRIVQRGLGLAAFLQSNDAERVMRDLSTYLRQPAPDETLVEAAAWFTRRDPPDPDPDPDWATA